MSNFTIRTCTFQFDVIDPLKTTIFSGLLPPPPLHHLAMYIVFILTVVLVVMG